MDLESAGCQWRLGTQLSTSPPSKFGVQRLGPRLIDISHWQDKPERASGRCLRSCNQLRSAQALTGKGRSGPNERRSGSKNMACRLSLAMSCNPYLRPGLHPAAWPLLVGLGMWRCFKASKVAWFIVEKLRCCGIAEAVTPTSVPISVEFLFVETRVCISLLCSWHIISVMEVWS